MPRKTTITVIEKPKVITLESTMTVKEVEKHQLKVIENSDAWKEHQKQHAGAKLELHSDKKEGEFEKLLGSGPKKKEDVKPEEMTAKKNEQDFEKAAAVTYGRGNGPTEGKKGNIYSGGHDHGTIMASCTCGQTFKTDEEGKTSSYTLKSEDAVKALSAAERSGYKQKSEEGFSAYKRRGSDEDDSPKAYGRR